jgi:type I restriction enzyme S subunit
MSGLPVGWSVAKLGEVGDWSSGGTPSRNVASYFGTKGIPWVKTGDLHHHPIREVDEFITEAGLTNSSAKIFPQGSLLVAMYGATIGQTGVLTFDAATNQACAALIAAGTTSEIIPYVWRYLISEQDNLKAIGQGGAQPNICQTILKEVQINVAPLNEQHRIVDKIDSLTAKSRRARDELDHMPRLVQKYKQAILAAAFRGDVTQEWRRQTGCGGMWEQTTIGHLLHDISYGTSKKCDYEAGSTPVLRIPNVQHGYIIAENLKYADFTPPELKKLSLEKGDILIIRSNGSLDLVGRSAVVDDPAVGMLFAGYLIRLRLNTDIAHPQFIQLRLQAADTRLRIEQLAKSTSGVNNINSTQIQSFPLLLPTLGEQREIMRCVEVAFNWIERLDTQATSARKLIDHLDQAILAKAFQGELVQQDPNDEPASVLLERIKGERPAEVARRIAKATIGPGVKRRRKKP